MSPPGSAEARWRYYGRRNVVAAFFCHFVAIGFFFYSYGVFFKPVAAELGGSRLEVSLGLTLASLCSAIAGPGVGRAVERFGARRVMLLGAGCFALGFFLLAAAGSLALFYAVTPLLGVGIVALGYLGPSTLVVSWFSARRATALGIAAMGVSLSGLLMPPLATRLVDLAGWRGGLRCYGVATALLLVPLLFWSVVDEPQLIGLHADGASADAVEEQPWSVKRLLGSKSFWAIAVGFGMMNFAAGAVLTHLVPMLTDLSLEPLRAATVLSAAAGAAIGGKVLLGVLGDRIGGRAAALVSTVLQLGGLLALIAASGYLGWLAAALGFGIGMGGIVPLHSALTAHSFGSRSLPRAIGLMRPATAPLGAAGIPLAGYLHDRSGDYRAAMWLCALALVLAMVAFAALGRVTAASRRAALPGSS